MGTLKANDYFYHAESVLRDYETQNICEVIPIKGWLSWRELCALRKEYEIHVIEKEERTIWLAQANHAPLVDAVDASTELQGD